MAKPPATPRKRIRTEQPSDIPAEAPPRPKAARTRRWGKGTKALSPGMRPPQSDKASKALAGAQESLADRIKQRRRTGTKKDASKDAQTSPGRSSNPIPLASSGSDNMSHAMTVDALLSGPLTLLKRRASTGGDETPTKRARSEDTPAAISGGDEAAAQSQHSDDAPVVRQETAAEQAVPKHVSSEDLEEAQSASTTVQPSHADDNEESLQPEAPAEVRLVPHAHGQQHLPQQATYSPVIHTGDIDTTANPAQDDINRRMSTPSGYSNTVPASSAFGEDILTQDVNPLARRNTTKSTIEHEQHNPMRTDSISNDAYKALTLFSQVTFAAPTQLPQNPLLAPALSPRTLPTDDASAIQEQLPFLTPRTHSHPTPSPEISPLSSPTFVESNPVVEDSTSTPEANDGATTSPSTPNDSVIGGARDGMEEVSQGPEEVSQGPEEVSQGPEDTLSLSVEPKAKEMPTKGRITRQRSMADIKNASRIVTLPVLPVSIPEPRATPALSLDEQFIEDMKTQLSVQSKRKTVTVGQLQAERMLELLNRAQPPTEAEALMLSNDQAQEQLQTNRFFPGPIFVEGAQPMPLETVTNFLAEYYDHDAKVSIQDPSLRRWPAAREITVGKLKERFQAKSKTLPWNCLEMAAHVEDGIRPAFLNTEDCRLITKLKHPRTEDEVSRRGFESGYKEIEKWALLAQAGSLTLPHQDSHGYSTFITVNQGVMGFGWCANPTPAQRKRWQQSPYDFNGNWRYKVVRPGQTVYFPNGTIHFVFRLQSAGDTLAFGGHVLRRSQIVSWIKTLLEEQEFPAITNEALSVSAPAYLERVATFVRQARRMGQEEKWGGAAAIREFLRLKAVFMEKGVTG